MDRMVESIDRGTVPIASRRPGAGNRGERLHHLDLSFSTSTRHWKP